MIEDGVPQDSLLKEYLHPNIYQFKYPDGVGAPIGSPLGSTLAELFMSDLRWNFLMPTPGPKAHRLLAVDDVLLSGGCDPGLCGCS